MTLPTARPDDPSSAAAAVGPVTCPGCGCVCDDLVAHVANRRIVRLDNVCSLGQAWFHDREAAPNAVVARLAGRPVSAEAALAAAADRLRAARYPLVFGLGQSTSETQRAALHLAEVLGGVADSHTSLTHGPTKVAAQLVGEVLGTLGEVKNRADLIVYWGVDPDQSHPRYRDRYAERAAGKFRPQGRADRTVVVVDSRAGAAAAGADLVLRPHPDRDFEVLTILRALVRGRRAVTAAAADTGLTLDQLQDLADRLKQARYAAVCFGRGLTTARGRHLTVAAALALVADLNACTRCVAVPLRDCGNEVGADFVFNRTTGYSLAVDYSRGYPRSNPGEFSAVELLSRGEVDAAVLVGEGPWGLLPPAARDHLGRIPVVTVGPTVPPLGRVPDVHLAAAVPGLHTDGLVYRMDRIPLPLRPVLPSSLPREDEWLERLRRVVTPPGS